MKTIMSEKAVCKWLGYILNCPVCSEPVKWDDTCKQECYFPLDEFKEG